MKNLKNIFKQSEFERSKPGHFEQSGEHLAATKSKRSQPINLSTCMLLSHICRTVVMRTCLLVYSVMIIYFVTCMIQDSVKWLLLIPLVFIILDAVFICVVRKGIEFDWQPFSFILAYTYATNKHLKTLHFCCILMQVLFEHIFLCKRNAICDMGNGSDKSETK